MLNLDEMDEGIWLVTSKIAQFAEAGATSWLHDVDMELRRPFAKLLAQAR